MSDDIETKLACLYNLIDDIQRAIRTIKVKNLNKKPRFDHSETIRISNFRQELTDIERRWGELIKGAFESICDITVHNNIADYVVETITESRSRFDIDDESYRLVWECLIKPIIRLIMDEEDVSKESTERQQRRRHLIKRLTNVKTITRVQEGVRRNSSDESSHSVVDVCSMNSPQRQTQRSSARSSCRVTSSRTFRATSEVLTMLNYTIESDIVLDLLFETVALHTKATAEDDTDLLGRIYHVINVTYILDSIRDALANIRSCLQDYQQSGITSPAYSQLLLCRSLDKFEKTIEESLQLYDPGKPLTIYRNDLRLLLFQINTLKKLANR